MKETNMKTRLLTLKTIKTIFDVVLVLASLLVVLNIVLHVFNITKGNDIIAGLALIEQNTEPIVIEGDINTTIDGLTINMKPVGLQVSYYFGGVDEHPVVVLHRMLYVVALNLGTIFFIFVLFLNAEGNRALDAVQVVVHAGGGIHEQGSGHPQQIQVFDQKALKKVLHGFDADLGIVQIQLGFISLWYHQVFHSDLFLPIRNAV